MEPLKDNIEKVKSSKLGKTLGNTALKGTNKGKEISKRNWEYIKCLFLSEGQKKVREIVS